VRNTQYRIIASDKFVRDSLVFISSKFQIFSFPYKEWVSDCFSQLYHDNNKLDVEEMMISTMY
jgi:hypothetical protein